ncbi:MAG: tol-pal system protein YbgF [Methylophaga sp.]|jgi:tol-pal system protein YbgF|uniref:tol-pal system protein YbgF n=1 Tax=unclassified Methylophaga TaxID=2629249 RepID=UPI000C918FCA|nr:MULTISPECIES: tol-pal system protein YbgF [unclassified Methylophaga]MAK68277.1 tol-pal system protein YbgF [Methylophaga sp.]MAY17573.1 tol-pal system protein YbgF [Methylophaga sp.]HAO26338.1 tol-pal system protein YbgF [Methylophaga sp.]HCD04155.1 tol-pal system protein YbgF [Methylophaga sp.]|tara:strand:- start:1446 stop:2282 length:837 start_codon:yes stop_codon:yes gene_type:complete
MPFKKRKQLAIAIMVGAFLAPTVSWAEQESIQARMDRLERIIQGQGLTSLLTQVDQLQREIQRLNGANEELSHKIDQMQQRQREQYLDLDQRLTEVQQQPAAAQEPTRDESASMTSEAAGAELADNELEQTARDSAIDNGEIDTLAPVAVESGEAAYQSALQDLRGGRYQEALTALGEFPQNYPNSTYLPNVYYWQGEAHYVLREFDKAIVAFDKVLSNYPDSNKVSDALLKRGFSEYETGDTGKAQETLNLVIQKYPDTSASRLARVRLDRIQQNAQ